MEYTQLTLDDYQQSKKEIRENIGGIVKSFVRIGWNLTKIANSQAYKMDGYSTIAEFAKAEYDMNPSGVSRFMKVYETYSVEGDNPELKEEYRDFKFTQLVDMLQLPEEDRELIRPEMSREGIRELNRFNKESENNPENLTAWMKETEDVVEKGIYLFYKNNPEIVKKMKESDWENRSVEELVDIVNPKGNTFYNTRKDVFLLMYDITAGVIVKAFNEEPIYISWKQFFEKSKEILKKITAEEEEKQQQEQQIPGQDSILNHEEYMPEIAPAQKEETGIPVDVQIENIYANMNFGKRFYIMHGKTEVVEKKLAGEYASTEKKTCGMNYKADQNGMTFNNDSDPEYLTWQQVAEMLIKRFGQEEKKEEIAPAQLTKCRYNEEYECDLSEEEKDITGDGTNCESKCCWNCEKHGQCKYECEGSVYTAREEKKEEPLSVLGYPKRVYPEGSLLSTKGCGSYDCFSCHRDGCEIRQEDCYCVEAPLGKPFPCTTLHVVENLRIDVGDKCQFVNENLAFHRAGDEQPVPCCRKCNDPCGYECRRSAEKRNAEKAQKEMYSIPYDEAAEEHSTAIDELELSVRTYNTLKRAGVNTIEELQNMSDMDLSKIRNFSQKCMDEVHSKLEEHVVEPNEIAIKPDDCVIEVNNSAAEPEDATYSEIAIRDCLGEEEKTLEEYERVNKAENLPLNLMMRQRMLVKALKLLLENETDNAQEEEEEIIESIQPELPVLKNNDQRKEWLNNYKEWGMWYRDENIDVNYYKYDFSDGSRLVVAEYPQRRMYWKPDKFEDEHYYHLLEKNRKYYGTEKMFEQQYVNSTDSETYLVEFLKNLQKGEKK